MFKWILTALLLINIAGCSLDYTLSDNGKTVHSGLTGVNYPVATIVAAVTDKYTEEEIAKALGDNKDSLARAKRYVTGEYTGADIGESIGVIIQLYTKK